MLLPAEIGTHEIEIIEGQAIVLSDCHYRPDEPPSTAHLAAVELTPATSAKNGATLGRGTRVTILRKKNPRLLFAGQAHSDNQGPAAPTSASSAGTDSARDALITAPRTTHKPSVEVFQRRAVLVRGRDVR